MKRILFQVAVMTIIVLAVYVPFVRWILVIGLVLIIGFVILLFRCNWDDDYSMIDKFGKDYKVAIANGKLGLHTLYPCKPAPHYTSKSAIDKIANVQLPNLVVKECKESLEDFTGDFSGEAIIEFQEVIGDDVLVQIRNDMKKEQSKWQKQNDGSYICLLSEPHLAEPCDDVYWSLSVKEGSAIGTIRYGRV